MTDSEFTKYLTELDKKDTEEYEFLTNSETKEYKIDIYRLYNENTGLYTYKGYGELINVNPEKAYAVYCDLVYRKKWDGYANELYVIRETDIEQIIYWRVAYPWPLSHRDYVFQRKSKIIDENGKKQWGILGKGLNDDSVKKKKGVIRVVEYEQTLAFQETDSGGTKVFMFYCDNPGGALPAWLINWAAKTGVPKFMDDLQKACKNYDKNNK